MSFSCTIKAGEKELTKWREGPIHSQLLGLGPNTENATPAPFRVTDLRDVVCKCVYGDRLPDAARDCFRVLQSMVAENLASLKEEPHCDKCKCFADSAEKEPEWWDADACRRFLAINADEITFVQGSY